MRTITVDDIKRFVGFKQFNGDLYFDYENQVWIKNGIYQKCGHLDVCNCFGKIHAGEKAD